MSKSLGNVLLLRDLLGQAPGKRYDWRCFRRITGI
jgi:cysteinyl-tRNA synthetase